MDTTYPVITQTYTPEETSRISGVREVLPQLASFKSIELYIPETTSFSVTPIKFRKGGETVSFFSNIRYKAGTTEVNDFIIGSKQGGGDTISYISLSTYQTVPSYQRDAFLQIYSSRLDGVFRSARMDFSLTNRSPSFSVVIQNSSGGGIIKLPELAADPAAGGGLMYYNTATNKVRICETGGWKDVV